MKREQSKRIGPDTGEALSTVCPRWDSKWRGDYCTMIEKLQQRDERVNQSSRKKGQIHNFGKHKSQRIRGNVPLAWE